MSMNTQFDLVDNEFVYKSLNACRFLISRERPSSSTSKNLLLKDSGINEEFNYIGEAATEHIKNLILRDHPCMISRLGSTELMILLTYLNISDNKPLLNKIFGYLNGN